jgi:hypothetical protein
MCEKNFKNNYIDKCTFKYLSIHPSTLHPPSPKAFLVSTLVRSHEDTALPEINESHYQPIVHHHRSFFR